MQEIPFDSKRRLCPDGACVGILGADGRCSVCQRPAGAAGAADVADVETETDGGAAKLASDSSEPSSPLGPTPSSTFDPNRRLCDDGSCVGIVGADGICGTCGRKAQ